MKILENLYKNVMPYGAAFAASNKGTTHLCWRITPWHQIFCKYIHLLSIWTFDASFIRLNDYATSFSIQTP